MKWEIIWLLVQCVCIKWLAQFSTFLFILVWLEIEKQPQKNGRKITKFTKKNHFCLRIRRFICYLCAASKDISEIRMVHSSLHFQMSFHSKSRTFINSSILHQNHGTKFGFFFRCNKNVQHAGWPFKLPPNTQYHIKTYWISYLFVCAHAQVKCIHHNCMLYARLHGNFRFSTEKNINYLFFMLRGSKHTTQM